VLGDDKYGDAARDRPLAREGVKRLFLHARALAFAHPVTGAPLRLTSPLPPDMRKFTEDHFALRPDRL
jgi:23S rRNA pseudouridine955/2504/2580 synthase